MALCLCCGGGEKSASEPAAEEPAKQTALPSNDAPEVAEEQAAEPDPIDAGIMGLSPDQATGVAECDRLLSGYLGCDKLPAQAREAFVKASETWKKTLENGGLQARTALSDACRQALAGARQALDALGCSDAQGGAIP